MKACGNSRGVHWSSKEHLDVENEDFLFLFAEIWLSRCVEKETNLENLQNCGPKMDCELLPNFPKLCSNIFVQTDDEGLQCRQKREEW